MVEIADRRNELSGNLSLYQELHFIERIDSLIEDGQLVGGGYKPITIRIIEMSRSHQVADSWVRRPRSTGTRPSWPS